MFKQIKKLAKANKTLLHFDRENKRPNDDDIALNRPDSDESVAENTARRLRMDLGEMHESSDEEDAVDDADATMMKSLSRHQENQEYEDSEEEKEEVEVEGIDIKKKEWIIITIQIE